MFGSVMKNKLENTFQCLVMSWENEVKNNLLIFYFSQVYYNNEEHILQIKKLNENEIEKKYIIS